jgi:hypothetical protein
MPSSFVRTENNNAESHFAHPSFETLVKASKRRLLSSKVTRPYMFTRLPQTFLGVRMVKENERMKSNHVDHRPSVFVMV